MVEYVYTANKRPKFKMGDYVRISVVKGKFQKDIILVGVERFSKLFQLIGAII